MKLKRCVALLIALIMMLSALPIVSVGADEVTAEPVNAEIMDAYGGADGIISMTFDDGYYETSLVLNELLAKYDLTASTMVIAYRTDMALSGYVTQSTGREIFSAGYLEPQGHAMMHINMKEGQIADSQKESTYKTEFVDSKELIETMFPGYDILTFAIPYGDMDADAYAYASRYYYAIRTTNDGVQTLNPGFTNEKGSWSKMYSPATGRLKYSIGAYTDEQQLEMIKNDIDKCANGWYIPITHKVGDEADAEMSYYVADKMFEYIAGLRDEGKVWVTTYSEAVKYVRERQNSFVNASMKNGKISVKVVMSDYTSDGLTLDADVFNTPLTVKVEVPASYKTVNYTVGTQQYTALAFNEGSKNYVYMDVVPNSGEIELCVSETHTFGEWEKHDADFHKRVCLDCDAAEYSEHILDEGEVILAPTHMKEGVMHNVCTVCSEESENPIEKTALHNFNCEVKKTKYKAADATCTVGRLYYYSCECGEAGTATFSSSEPLGHEGMWRVVDEATEDEDGLERRICLRCGDKEERVIPATGTSGEDDNTTAEPTTPTEPQAPSQPSEGAGSGSTPSTDASGSTDDSGEEDDSDSLVLIISICSGVAVVAAGVAVVIIIKKKRKK